MKRNKILSLLLALVLMFSLAACAEPASETNTSTVSPSPEESSSAPEATSPTPSESETPEESGEPEPSTPAADTQTRLAFLNGPTGVGAAKLLHNIDEGTASGNYTYEVVTDNSEIVGMLSGADPEVDIAAVATNVALNLYNKTEGGIQILALNTLGVLYVLEGGGEQSIQSMADLAGKTVYAVGQGANPQYTFQYLLEQNELDPENDLTIQWVTAEEATQAVLSGQADAALLPVPAATACIAKSEGKVRAALDLTAEWDDLRTGSILTMGCIVARTAFVEEHPEVVSQFLTEYAASIDYVTANVDEAATLVESYGLAPSAAIAKKAIPDCHLVCITGRDIQSAIDGYYAVLFQADPASIGGSLPDDGFYYVP